MAGRILKFLLLAAIGAGAWRLVTLLALIELTYSLTSREGVRLVRGLDWRLVSLVLTRPGKVLLFAHELGAAVELD